ncbi:gamma-glutamyltransferase, partial [Rhizobium ruizarguesonis]
FLEPYALSPDTEKTLAAMGYSFDGGNDAPQLGQAAGILVGGKSLAAIEKGGGARYNCAMDSRAAEGSASGY